MFAKNDFYHLDEMAKTLEMSEMMIMTQIQCDTIKALLISKGIITELDYQAATKYIESTPEIKRSLEALEKSKAALNKYKNDPQQHLKDLFAAKLNRQI